MLNISEILLCSLKRGIAKQKMCAGYKLTVFSGRVKSEDYRKNVSYIGTKYNNAHHKVPLIYK